MYLHVRDLTLVADDASPAIGTIAAGFPGVTFASVQTVVTRQTAVVAKSVVQTHWRKTDIKSDSDRAQWQTECFLNPLDLSYVSIW